MKCLLAGVVVAAAAAAGPAVARAESEQAVSLGLGWATFSGPGEAMGDMEPPTVSPTIGGSLSLMYERAIGTDFLLRGELVGGLFYGGTDEDDTSEVSNALLADAGVAVRFDVLKYVPYAFAGLGAITTGGGPLTRETDLALVIGGGIDWLQSRSRSYGIEVRLVSFGGETTVVTAGLRGTVRWGYF